jgi:predicted metal-dependent hydrolase
LSSCEPSPPERVLGEGFEVVVVRSPHRRTVTLQVADGAVVLRVPAAVSRSWIEGLVARKTRWIREKVEVQAAHRPPVRRYVDGERFEFLGVARALRVEPGATRGVSLQDDRLIIGLPEGVREPTRYVRQRIVHWYRGQALDWLSDRCARYAVAVGRNPRSVSVRTYRSRWGSCDSRGHIRFNWLAVAAPPPVIDYLVVHELCHLLHMNHSPAFWRAVGGVIPDYREHRNWLKLYGARLSV